MLNLLFTHPLLFLLASAMIVLAISLHEFAHAWMADHLGDPTPRLQGRLTLDPRAHLDPLGTLVIFFVGFGWGKPVPFDPFNLRHPKKDQALIALAGPASNLLFALLLSLIAKLPPFQILYSIFYTLITLNIALAVFNLVPIYPLDGEKILLGLLPHDLALEYRQLMHQYGTILLIFLIWPFSGTSPISALINPVIDLILHLLT